MGWVTIKTYNFGHEATIAQHLLENEGIETHLMDDLSIQVNPLYSNALGGVKLQVWEEDVERAMQLLHQQNMLQDEDVGDIITDEHREQEETNEADVQEQELKHEDEEEKEQSTKQKSSNKFLLAGAIVGVLVIVAAVSYFLQPTIEERLYANTWCANYVIVGTETYYPNTLGPKVVLGDRCNEEIIFHREGNIYFPGFNTDGSYGNWQMKGNKLHIALHDTALHALNGAYDLHFKGNSLMFISSQVTISTTANHLHYYGRNRKNRPCHLP